MGIENIISAMGLKTTNYWVSLLRTLPPYEVGVIKVSAHLFHSSSLFHSFVEEICYLVKEANILLPIVVEAKKNSLDFYQKKLAKALHRQNISVFLGEPHLIYLDLSFTLKKPHVVTIFTAPIIQAILERKVPILFGAGISPDKKITPIPALILARELVYLLHAKKLILVGHTPICTKDGCFITDILSWQEWQKKISSKEIAPTMARRVKAAFDLLTRLGPGHSVQITRPQQRKDGTSTGLLEELLGNGSGTYIAIPPLITVYPLQAVDEGLLFQAINAAFAPLQKTLKKNYFTTIKSYNPLVYLDSLGKGGAIVYFLDHTPYMCKLFIRQNYEGIGIGTTIIQTIYTHFGSLCWRASYQNEKALHFYDRLLQDYNGTSEKTSHYIMYFIGKATEKKEKLLPLMTSLPSSFE